MPSKKILIVDDEPDVVRYLTTVLKDHGFETAAAASVREAHSLLQEMKPDLISLDIMMPKKSGIAFYQELKKDSDRRDIPVVIVSGIKDSEEFDFREFVPDESIPEPEAFIEKPIEISSFLKTIHQIVG